MLHEIQRESQFKVKRHPIKRFGNETKFCITKILGKIRDFVYFVLIILVNYVILPLRIILKMYA